MLFSKEFYDVMAMFEKVMKQQKIYGRMELEDKSQWSRKVYYMDGKVNELFIMFLNGYQWGKTIS